MQVAWLGAGCHTCAALTDAVCQVKVSVIIPAYNEERLLGESLNHVHRAMQAFVSRDWAVELIVCDNNSSDETASVARTAGAKVVFEPVNQIARARNSGAAAATGDWFIFVDADSHPSPELFAAAANAIASDSCIAGGAPVDMLTVSRLANFSVRGWNFISRTLQWMAGSFLFCRADVFRSLSGFNQELFASEEIDLSRRLKRFGRKVGKPVVILRGVAIKSSPRKIWLYTTGEYIRFICKAMLTLGGSIRKREGCTIWYDGRR